MENYAWFRAEVGQLFLKGPVHIPGSGGIGSPWQLLNSAILVTSCQGQCRHEWVCYVLIQLFIKTGGGVQFAKPLI